MNEARAAFVLSLFVGSIVAGVVLQHVADSGIRPNPYATLDLIEEPAVTADVATAISNDDSKALSQLMDRDQLQALQKALLSPLDAPFTDVQSVKFLGATQKGSRTVAAYVLSGKDVQGVNAIIGFVLDVENGRIVGVND